MISGAVGHSFLFADFLPRADERDTLTQGAYHNCLNNRGVDFPFSFPPDNKISSQELCELYVITTNGSIP